MTNGRCGIEMMSSTFFGNTVEHESCVSKRLASEPKQIVRLLNVHCKFCNKYISLNYESAGVAASHVQHSTNSTTIVQPPNIHHERYSSSVPLASGVTQGNQSKATILLLQCAIDAHIPPNHLMPYARTHYFPRTAPCSSSCYCHSPTGRTPHSAQAASLGQKHTQVMWPCSSIALMFSAAFGAGAGPITCPPPVPAASAAAAGSQPCAQASAASTVHGTDVLSNTQTVFFNTT